jgi:hypothetical protein
MKFAHLISISLCNWAVLCSVTPKFILINPESNKYSVSSFDSNLILSIDHVSVYVGKSESRMLSPIVEIPFSEGKELIALKRQAHDMDGEDAASLWAQSVHRVVGQEVVYEKKELILIYVNSLDWEESLRDLISPYTAIIPSSIIPVSDFNSQEKLPKDHVINRRIEDVSFNEKISELIDIMDVDSIKSNVRFLTGEDTESFITTRNSKSEGISMVAQWIGRRMEELGCPDVSYYNFMEGYGPNVICTFTGKKEPEKLVIMSSHYDDREKWMLFPENRAPGADDDGSGTGAVLEAIRVLSSPDLELDYTVQVITFCGEEQGLYGSKAYASSLQQKEANIVAMIQNDMLGYRKPGEEFQIGFPHAPGYATSELNELLIKVTKIYAPELNVGYTTACCSDHYYFHKFGFPASASFERMGPIADPMYHNVGDRTDRKGYDFEQIWLIGR